VEWGVYTRVLKNSPQKFWKAYIRYMGKRGKEDGAYIRGIFYRGKEWGEVLTPSLLHFAAHERKIRHPSHFETFNNYAISMFFNVFPCFDV